jgi:hypothetical protein
MVLKLLKGWADFVVKDDLWSFVDVMSAASTRQKGFETWEMPVQKLEGGINIITGAGRFLNVRSNIVIHGGLSCPILLSHDHPALSMPPPYQPS